MAFLKTTGPNAATTKYDILTALSVFALSQDKHTMKLALRLMALITARYNWRTATLSMGHQEIAKLWSVDPRTVKREMAKLRDRGWIIVKQAGARGRVGSYAISFETILKNSQGHWANVGDDFVERAGALLHPATDSTVVKVDFGKQKKAPLDPTEIAQGDWSGVCGALSKSDPMAFQSWIQPLVFSGFNEGVLNLKAPSLFHARYVETHFQNIIIDAARFAFPELKTLRLQ